MQFTSALAVAALAGVAAAAGAPQAPAAAPFSLKAVSANTTLSGMMAIEQHTTDTGVTNIMFAKPGAAADLVMSGMSLEDGQILVSAPLRKGGSEPDFWAVGAIDNSTGLATPVVKPAGYGKGFYVRNAIAGRPMPTISPVTANPSSASAAAPTITETTTVTTLKTMQRRQRGPRTSGLSQSSSAPASTVIPIDQVNREQYLGYKDTTGREAKFYACANMGAVGSSTATQPPRERPTPLVRAAANGTNAQPQLMFGYGTAQAPRGCTPIMLQLTQ